MQITFLGTAGMVPTKERNVQGIYLEYRGEGILIDCGEGTQRQMNIAGINRLKVRKILITHWHGDHVAGLIGLIQTLGNVEEPKPITIYGPKGSKQYFEHMMKSCAFDMRLEVEIKEIIPKTNKPITFYENEHYRLEAAPLRHSIPCLGYAFIEKDRRKIMIKKAEKLGLKEGPELGRLQRGETITHKGKTIKPEDVSYIVKGKKVSFILDTEPCEAIHELVKDSDLMISEANFSSALEEKAEQYKHLTAQTAAQIASQAGVKKLILTHFSQRYKTIEELEEEAKRIFNNTTCAYDFMKIKI